MTEFILALTDRGYENDRLAAMARAYDLGRIDGDERLIANLEACARGEKRVLMFDLMRYDDWAFRDL